MIKKHKKFLLIAIGVLLVGTLSLTYAYFAGGAGPGANTDINLTASRTEKLIFDEGDPINLLLNEVTLAQGGGNVTGSSTATATLIASETTNNSAANYNVYLNINFNNFVYTTTTNTPEIIAEITDPTGAKVTSITGLTHTTVTDNQGNTTTGFDITNKVGRFDVKLDESITSTDSVTGVTEDWTIKVTYINLDTNQAANSGNSMDVSFVLDQRDNVLLNEIADADTFATTIAEVTNDTAPLIDEMRFSSTKSADYETATLKWDVSANTGSEEVIAYIEDHPTDGRILHVQANGDVVFYEMVDKDIRRYIELLFNDFYLDSSFNYIDGTLTNYEISLLCHFDELTNNECSIKYYIDEADIGNIISFNYFSNIDFINLSSNINTSNVTDMRSMFSGSAAAAIDVSGLDTSNVTDMSFMFSSSAATAIDVSGLDTSNVTDMSWMFNGSEAIVIDISGIDTSNVTDMSAMFYVSAATTINVSGLDTSKVTDMRSMFGSSAATTINISGLDTSKVTDMRSMFGSSAATILDVSGFDTSNVTDMSSMFSSSAATVLDVSGFDTSNVTDISRMFSDSAATDLDVSGFDFSLVTDASYMLSTSSSSTTDVYVKDSVMQTWLEANANPSYVTFVIAP